MTLVPPAPATIAADVVVPTARSGAAGPNIPAPDGTDPAATGVRPDNAPSPAPEHAEPEGEAPEHAEPEHADPEGEAKEQEPEQLAPAPAPARASSTTPRPVPRVRPVRIAPPTGDVRPETEDRLPREASGTRPRFGVVSVPEPSRAAPARRRGVPSVRALRLTDEPATRADRPTDRPTDRPPARPATPSTAAVTPVPLPVPRPPTPAEHPSTESRTEEPQP